MYQYIPKGVCPRLIEFDLENNIVKNLKFTGGCNGNLKALGKLVEGMPKDEVITKLSGITCGNRPTSCADQLSKALQETN